MPTDCHDSLWMRYTGNTSKTKKNREISCESKYAVSRTSRAVLSGRTICDYLKCSVHALSNMVTFKHLKCG